jgi:hypothetical protein
MDAPGLSFPTPDRSSRAQHWFLGGLLLLFVGLSIQYSLKVTKPTHGPRSAINRWASQIQEMEAGEDIHKRHHYPNPPIMAMLLMPFSELATVSPLAAALVWFYIKVGLALLCMLWVFRMIETPDRPFPTWAKAAAVLLSIRPILSDLSHGNINIFILFLVIASLYAFTRGRDFLAGVMLALAIACKVTPALFIGYFFWKQSWRVLLGCGCGLVLFFLAIPAAYLGWENNLRDLTSWVEVMILPYLAGGIVTSEHNNQSLPGLVARLLTNAPSFTVYWNDAYAPICFHTIADIGQVAAKWLVKACMALFVLLVVWRCRAPIDERGRSSAEVRANWKLSAEYSLILLGMLLFSERTWKHHCVTLLLPFAVLCYGVAAVDMSRRRRALLIGTQIVASLLIASTSTGVIESEVRLQSACDVTAVGAGPTALLTATMTGAFTDSFGKVAQVYGAYVWAFFVLLIGIAALMQRQPTLVDTLRPWWFLKGRVKLRPAQPAPTALEEVALLASARNLPK